MERNSKRLVDLSPGEKRLIIRRMFCNEHLQEYCELLGLRPTDTLNTLIGIDVVDALIEGIEGGLEKAVKGILDQRRENAKAVERWISDES